MATNRVISTSPLCFILMPFGKKPGIAPNSIIDFDSVYNELIAPAVKEAGMQVLRADEEIVGGIIHKVMFERLILCDFAVADITTANANVFYELGIRHGIRPRSTVLIDADANRPPFDVAPLRYMPYKLSPGGIPDDVENAKNKLIQLLVGARQTTVDSPVFDLIKDFNPPEISHLKTDLFREKAEYSQRMKDKLAEAREKGDEAIHDIEKELGDISQVESGVIIDMFLSYRSVKAYKEMVALVGKMSAPLASTTFIQEQFAFALNRDKKSERAQLILDSLIKIRASPETYGLLGRVYKDRWDESMKNKEFYRAKGLLRKAIESYQRGFEADWRDAYPGINAVTLMEISEPPDERRHELLPVVRYSVKRKIASGKPDYWDYATLLEIAVLMKEQKPAEEALGEALACPHEIFNPETTANNLRIIREARERRNEVVPWAAEMEQILIEASKQKEQMQHK